MKLTDDNQATLASLLTFSLTSSGVMDAYDDLLAEVETLPELAAFHHEVMTGIEFINAFGSDNFELAEFQEIYNNEIVYRKS